MATNQDDIIERGALLDTIKSLAGELADSPVEFDEMHELITLRAVLVEADTCAGSRDDYVIVRDSAFEDYARDCANGLGEIGGWPYDYIDWEKAARALQQDYAAIDFDGVTYWVRT